MIRELGVIRERMNERRAAELCVGCVVWDTLFPFTPSCYEDVVIDTKQSKGTCLRER